LNRKRSPELSAKKEDVEATEAAAETDPEAETEVIDPQEMAVTDPEVELAEALAAAEEVPPEAAPSDRSSLNINRINS
jgi:hypothetical protein